MKVADVVRRHPVGAYLGLAFAISWGGSLLIGGPIALRGAALAAGDLWRMGGVVLAGPLLAGLAMSALADGRAGLRDMWARMRRWRVGA